MVGAARKYHRAEHMHKNTPRNIVVEGRQDESNRLDEKVSRLTAFPAQFFRFPYGHCELQYSERSFHGGQLLELLAQGRTPDSQVRNAARFTSSEICYLNGKALTVPDLSLARLNRSCSFFRRLKHSKANLVSCES